MLTILCGDVIEQLRTLPDESVHCCVTSPPYWGLRDYSTNGQLGLEKTPEEYVAKMVEVFREVRRVLRKDGTLWMNMGDSYATSGGKQPDDAEWVASQARAADRGYDVGGWGACRNKTQGASGRAANTAISGLKPKDLCGIPWRLAFALQTDGWWLRSDIIWAKPNPMPESVTDRPTKAHEYIFLLTKSANYFYDAEAIKELATKIGTPWHLTGGNGERAGTREGLRGSTWDQESGRNKRTVWTVATAPYPEAHFATYPPDLIKPCILAGTSAKGCCAKCGSPWERIVEREIVSQFDSPRYSGVSLRNDSEDGRTERSSKTIGWQPTCKCPQNYRGILKSGFGSCAKIVPCTVLDPFAGSGTTGAVALELGRKAILIELNPKYVELIKTRCNITPGLQLA